MLQNFLVGIVGLIALASGAAAQNVQSATIVRSQLNVNFLQTAGDYAFINALKSAQSWTYGDNSSVPLPNELDENGYPIPGSRGMNSHGGLYTLFFIPSQANRLGSWCVDWTGSGTIEILGIQTTTVSGSHTSSPWCMTPAANSVRVMLQIRTTKSGNPIQNLRFYFIGQCKAPAPNRGCGDYDDLLAGKVTTPQFRNIVKGAKIGSLRLLDWVTDNSDVTNLTNWSLNKPATYVFYQGAEFRASLYAGKTNSMGNAYSITFGTGAPSDKELIIVQFNASARPGQNVTLDLNGTGAIDVTDMCACGSDHGLFGTEFPIAGRLSTLVYDSDLNRWLKYGGDNAIRWGGIVNGVPPSVYIQVCNELSVDCWVTLPYLALDPDQGYTASLARLAQLTLYPRLKLIAEPPNETWNIFYPQTFYGKAKAAAHWPSAGPGDVNQWYGQVLSSIGQSVSDVFGSDKTRYSVVGCEWTRQLSAGSSVDSRFTSSNYVTLSGGQPAYRYATHLCITGYYGSAEYGTAPEIVDAYNYVTGNGISKRLLQDSYAAGVTSTDNLRQVTLPNLNTIYRNWAATVGRLNSTYGAHIELNQYEGGYSPDFDNGNNVLIAGGGKAPIVSATNANPAVLTLGSDGYGKAFSAVPGMIVTISGAKPTTWNGTYTIAKVSGNSVTTATDSGDFGKFVSGSITYAAARASIANVTNANPCVFSLSSPFTVTPGFSVEISDADPAPYNGNQQVIATSSDGLRITTNLNCSSLGPIARATISAPMWTAVNTLRDASKFAPHMFDYTLLNYKNFSAAGGKGLSQFTLSGNGWSTNGVIQSLSAWPAFEPDLYSTPTPAWKAISASNGG